MLTTVTPDASRERADPGVRVLAREGGRPRHRSGAIEETQSVEDLQGVTAGAVDDSERLRVFQGRPEKDLRPGQGQYQVPVHGAQALQGNVKLAPSLKKD